MQANLTDIILRIATIVVPIGAIFVGIGLERYKARYIILTKSLENNKIGTSLSDVNYGDISILYQGKEIKGNLIFIATTLTNSSWTSLAALDIKYAFKNGVRILQSRSFLLFEDGHHALLFTEDFDNQFKQVLNELDAEEKSEYFDYDFNYVTRHREYATPHLNKGQKIVTEFLIETNNVDENVIVFPMRENVKIVTVDDDETIKKNRMTYIHIIASVYYVSTAVLLLNLSFSAEQCVWLMLANSLTCYILAWASWFIFRYIKYVAIK